MDVTPGGGATVGSHEADMKERVMEGEKPENGAGENATPDDQARGRKEGRSLTPESD